MSAYLSPFMQFLADKAPTVKKVYWVAPPTSGRVTVEIQDFLLKKLEHYECLFLKVLDSRTMLKYPYRNTMPDKEHFVGKDMELWAEGVFNQVSEDLAAGLLTAQPLSRDRLTVASAKMTTNKPQNAASDDRKSLSVRARLVSKSEPLPLEKLLPYQESMVAYVYRVEEVLSGEYAEKEIVVMHPAHIRLKPEPLSAYKVGKLFTLNILEFDGSLWESIKKSEETGRMALRPYIRKEDEARFPSLAR
ncbi:MAG: hypothetical protein EBS01_00500 [Verrucomicrobia bacterium]|nr:hypothetical protein [Verrucomicrobiota bacterium]